MGSLTQRMTVRRGRREWQGSILFSDAFFQLMKVGFVSRHEDTQACVRRLRLIVIWLEMARTLYQGRLGDPHKFAAANLAACESLQSQIQALRADGLEELAAEIESSKEIDSAILYAGIFPVKYLSHSKGNPKGAARAWIIRMLDGYLIPKNLSPEEGRWAVIAELLELTDIPANPTLVRSVATRSKKA